MAESDHLRQLSQGERAWRTWREEHPDLHPDFRGADLRRRMLREFDLSGSNLSGADLRDANFRRSNLRNAQLDGAKLYRTFFSATNLSGASFKRAVLYETIFANVDLSKAKNLGDCVHKGPSVLDHRTLSRSSLLPRSFLQGCGLPDDVIANALNPRSAAKEFDSCFISYSTHDQDFAERLHADLQSKGVRCWFAPHNIQGGKKIHEQIDEAIRVYNRLLLILSEASMASEWVKTEIAHARQKEINQKRQVLFPISLVPYTAIRDWKSFDGDTGKDSAKEVREYFIPDFSGWKDHDQFQQAFNKLLKDLKNET